MTVELQGDVVLQNAFPLVADTVEAESLAEPKISVEIELKNDVAITDQGVEGASPVTQNRMFPMRQRSQLGVSTSRSHSHCHD